MKRGLFIVLSIIALSTISSCGHPTGTDGTTESFNGIYYWKTTFRLSEEDSSFLENNKISRIYLRLFDVDREAYAEPADAVPVGTLRFESQVPSGMEIVPTVFITLDALSVYEDREEELARLITRRMMAMCSYNDIEGVREFQFDCDWTKGTKAQYIKLCEAAKAILHPQGISLSGTIRLHQVEEAVYPFDRGVLMLYNIGAIKDPHTGNSIISYDDVNKYLGVKSRVEKFNKARRKNCPQIDFAYPTFSWGVCYLRDGSFDGIVRTLEFDSLTWLEKKGDRYYVKESGLYDGQWYNEGQFVRAEYSDIKEIMKVKKKVEATIGRKEHSNIIFHLDQDNLSNYRDDEIAKILR